MATSLEVVLSDPAVKAVFINIFGGITRCDLVARGRARRARARRGHGAARGAARRHERREGRAILAEAAHPRIVLGRHDARGGRASRRPRERTSRVSILVGADTRLVVQGLTGKEGTFHTLRNRAYGTDVVAGVTPGKGGQDVEGIPVFDTVADAVRRRRREHVDDLRAAAVRGRGDPGSRRRGRRRWSCASPKASRSKDMALVHSYLRGRGTTLVGPNCPGVISPGVANVGIIPPEVCMPGRVGFVSRSGTLVYQIVHELTQRGIGQSTCVGMGGDPVHGIGFIEALACVRGRSRDRPDDHDRRDRRRRRGACGRLHRRARHEAGRRLHRRLRGAAGQAHGPRRRDRHRHRRAPPRRRPRRSRRAACGWRAPRARSPSWCRRRSDDLRRGRRPPGDLARARPRRRVTRRDRRRRHVGRSSSPSLGQLPPLAAQRGRRRARPARPSCAVGWLYTMAGHAVAIRTCRAPADRSGDLGSRRSTVRLGMLTIAAIAIAALVLAGRATARRVTTRGARRAVAGALIAVPYAVAARGVNAVVELHLDDRRRVPARGDDDRRSRAGRVRRCRPPSLWSPAARWMVDLVVVASSRWHGGASGAAHVRVGDRSQLRRRCWHVRRPASGRARAVLRRRWPRRVLSAQRSTSGTRRWLLPNQAIWILAPSMGGCVSITVRRGRARPDLPRPHPARPRPGDVVDLRARSRRGLAAGRSHAARGVALRRGAGGRARARLPRRLGRSAATTMRAAALGAAGGAVFAALVIVTSLAGSLWSRAGTGSRRADRRDRTRPDDDRRLSLRVGRRRRDAGCALGSRGSAAEPDLGEVRLDLGEAAPGGRPPVVVARELLDRRRGRLRGPRCRRRSCRSRAGSAVPECVYCTAATSSGPSRSGRRCRTRRPRARPRRLSTVVLVRLERRRTAARPDASRRRCAGTVPSAARATGGPRCRTRRRCSRARSGSRNACSGRRRRRSSPRRRRSRRLIRRDRRGSATAGSGRPGSRHGLGEVDRRRGGCYLGGRRRGGTVGVGELASPKLGGGVTVCGATVRSLWQ